MEINMLSKIDYPTVRKLFIPTENINDSYQVTMRLEKYVKDSYIGGENTYSNLFNQMTQLDIKELYGDLHRLKDTTLIQLSKMCIKEVT
jgi:hypothetical protein